MRRRALRMYLWLILTLGGGTLFQTCTTADGGVFSWQRLIGNGALSITNWCTIIDCSQGFFGGIMHPCNDPSAGPLFLDCPNFVPADEGTTGAGTV